MRVWVRVVSTADDNETEDIAKERECLSGGIIHTPALTHF